jgi:hypothetical protein
MLPSNPLNKLSIARASPWLRLSIVDLRLLLPHQPRLRPRSLVLGLGRKTPLRLAHPGWHMETFLACPPPTRHPLLLQPPWGHQSWTPLGMVPTMGGLIPITWIPLNMGGHHHVTHPRQGSHRQPHMHGSRMTARIWGGLKTTTFGPPILRNTRWLPTSKPYQIHLACYVL